MRFLLWLYSLAGANQSSSFTAVKITAMGFGSGPFFKKGLMGFIHQETFQVHSHEEASALESLTDQTTPGRGHRSTQSPALGYPYEETFQPQVRGLVSQAAELFLCFGAFFPWNWFNFISKCSVKKENILKCFIKHSNLLTSISIDTTTSSCFLALWCIFVIFYISFHFVPRIWLSWQSFSLFFCNSSRVFSKRM